MFRKPILPGTMCARNPCTEGLTHPVSLLFSQDSVNDAALQGFPLFCEARSHALVLGESRLLAKMQGFENLGPLRAARLPAVKQRSEQSTERCGTDSGRAGNSQTLTCSRPNGDLVAKKPWSPGSPRSCTLGITTAAWFLHFQNKTILMV